MFRIRHFLAAAPSFVLWAGAAVAQNVIVIPDSGDRPFVVTPMQTIDGVGISDRGSKLVTEFEPTDLRPELIFTPGLIADGKVGLVIVHAEKGKKASKPIPSCKGPISVSIDTGSPRSLGTAQCGNSAAFCTVALNANTCKAKSMKPNKQQAGGECTVVAGSADAARGFCMFAIP